MEPTSGGSELGRIESQLDDIRDQVTVVSSVAAGLNALGGTVTDLMSSLEMALIAQQEAEAARRQDALHSRQRFWVTIGGIVMANIILVTISVALLLNQQTAREESEARSLVNRDRQACATTLMVEWQARLGDALRVTTQVPPPDPNAPETRQVIGDLNRATGLLNGVEDLCYGPVPNPNPVPNR